MRRVHNEPGLMKDEKTGVIINTDESAYEMILQNRRHKEELGQMSREVEELKQLVKALVHDTNSHTN